MSRVWNYGNCRGPNKEVVTAKIADAGMTIRQSSSPIVGTIVPEDDAATTPPWSNLGSQSNMKKIKSKVVPTACHDWLFQLLWPSHRTN